MARQNIDTTVGGGDTAKAGGDKINAMFTELYARMADAEAALAALQFGGAVTPTPLSSYSIADASTTEGDSGTKILNFVVTRSGLTSGASSIDYTVTSSGTNPANAADFAGSVLAAGTINFAAGETTKNVPISIAGDAAVEQNETFTVTISNPSSAGTITAASATGTIVNDDTASTPGAITIDPIVLRNGQQYTFTARRTTNLTQAESRAVSLAPSTDYLPAAKPADLIGVTAVANFAANSATAVFAMTFPTSVQPE